MNNPGQGRPNHDEREWLAQERALHEARGGFEMPSDDIALLQYRSIARALRQPPVDLLPADFAARVARIAEDRVATERRAVHADGPVFEQVLVRILSAAFVLAALAALGIYGGRLLAMLQSATGGEGLQWALVLATCAGLTWAFEWLRRRAEPGHDEHGRGGPMPAA